MSWSKAGHGGLALEGFKFAVYLLIPIGATIVYSDPANMKSIVDHFKFISFPPDQYAASKSKLQAEALATESRKLRNGTPNSNSNSNLIPSNCRNTNSR